MSPFQGLMLLAWQAIELIAHRRPLAIGASLCMKSIEVFAWIEPCARAGHRCTNRRIHAPEPLALPVGQRVAADAVQGNHLVAAMSICARCPYL
jgi:hypothetical protein